MIGSRNRIPKLLGGPILFVVFDLPAAGKGGKKQSGCFAGVMLASIGGKNSEFRHGMIRRMPQNGIGMHHGEPDHRIIVVKEKRPFFS